MRLIFLSLDAGSPWLPFAVRRPGRWYKRPHARQALPSGLRALPAGRSGSEGLPDGVRSGALDGAPGREPVQRPLSLEKADEKCSG